MRAMQIIHACWNYALDMERGKGEHLNRVNHFRKT